MSSLSSPKRREQKEKEKEMDFFTVKASFLAGIILFITILKNIAELFITIDVRIVAFVLILVLLAFGLILGTHRFDEKFKSRAVTNFGSFLTVCSIPYFLVENSILRYQDYTSDFETVYIMVSISIIILAGGIYILAYKKK